MKEYIASFIKEKDLSENSQTAYSYDLDQFVDTVHNHVSDTNLRIYQASIKDFKPAVQKRKLSAVNQFFVFIFINIKLLRIIHRLVLPKVSVPKSHDQELLGLIPLVGRVRAIPRSLDCPIDCRDGLVAQ